jgi:hypothetical protein
MTQETIGHVEFTRDGERLSLRYARSFARKAGWQMLALLLVGAGLLPWLAWKAAHSDSLNWSRRELCALFLPLIGAVLTIIALVCLAHLVFLRHRALLFDRGTGTCSVPRWFTRPLVLPLSQIESVLVTVRETWGRRRSVSVTKTMRLVLRGRPKRYQRLWGWVGLPSDTGVEPVAEAIAAFVGCPCATVLRRPGLSQSGRTARSGSLASRLVCTALLSFVLVFMLVFSGLLVMGVKQAGTYLFGLIALVPLTIAAATAYGIYSVWRQPRPAPAPQDSLLTRLALRIKQWLDAGMVVVVGSFFLLFGSVGFYFLTATPIYQCLAARSWTPTPCVVLSSRVVKSKVFHLYVLYSYEFNGQQYKSSYSQFGETASPDGRGKRAFAARYPSGHKAVCYVNPKDPADAVLDRSMNREALWVGWFVMHPVVIGAAILFLAFRHARKKRISDRVQFFLWSLAAATISNEVVGLFAWQRVIPAWRRGGSVSIDLIGYTAIMIVFGSMGLILLVVFLFALVGLFKPRQKGGRKRAVSKAPTPATAGVAVPYGVDQRPMPTGDDLDRLLPLQVGGFTRTELRRPADLYRDPVYAQYRKDKAEVFVELGVCGDARGAQEALATAKAETEAEPGQVIQACSEGMEPSYLKTVSPTLGAFLAWTRGGYYFSAHAKGGEGDLESFVREFPY